MKQLALVEIDIVKRNRKFYVIVTDDIERHEVGPFKTKQKAQEIVQCLNAKAHELGGVAVP